MFSTEVLLGLGVPGGRVVLNVGSHCRKAVAEIYSEGFRDGVASNGNILTGHKMIAEYLNISERKSQEIFAKASKDGEHSGVRGKSVVVEKREVERLYKKYR